MRTCDHEPAVQTLRHLQKICTQPSDLGRHQELQEEATSDSIHPPQSDKLQNIRIDNFEISRICCVECVIFLERNSRFFRQRQSAKGVRSVNLLQNLTANHELNCTSRRSAPELVAFISFE
jgi:hypothetical protein